MDLEPNLGVALDFAKGSSWPVAKQLSVFELLKAGCGLAAELHVSNNCRSCCRLNWRQAPCCSFKPS